MKRLNDYLREHEENKYLEKVADKKREMLVLLCNQCGEQNTLFLGFCNDDRGIRTCSCCNSPLLNKEGSLDTNASILSFSVLPSFNCQVTQSYESIKLVKRY